jgi:YcaO-like protein with predicted kinase domain
MTSHIRSSCSPLDEWPSHCCFDDPSTAPKGYRFGTDRSVTPHETIERVQPVMSDMGITRLATVTHLDVIGVPVVMACRPNSRSLAVTQGKGLTLDAAKASALMEAVEGYHADHVTLPLILGSFDDLQATHDLLDPYTLPTGGSGPFISNRPLLWINGTELTAGERLWLPFDVVHTDFTFDSRLGQGMFDITSNGLASGNHILEALSHAICEVIERDATALWSMLPAERQNATRLNLGSIDDSNVQSILRKLSAVQMSVGIWETTSEIGLPAFISYLTDAPDRPNDGIPASEGMGCHPRREIAVLRALTEAIQGRLTFVSGVRDDLFPSSYETLCDPRSLAYIHTTIAAEGRGRDFADVPTYDNPSFADDVALELQQLRSAGFGRIVAVDLTKPGVNIPVVRVVIPGLECFISASSYRPGRRALAHVGARR